MIYWIGTSLLDPVKIGYATDPDRRLAELQVGSPERLVLFAVIPGDRADESRLHAHLRAYRLRGEWFKPVAPVLDAGGLLDAYRDASAQTEAAAKRRRQSERKRRAEHKRRRLARQARECWRLHARDEAEWEAFQAGRLLPPQAMARQENKVAIRKMVLGEDYFEGNPESTWPATEDEFVAQILAL